MRSAVVALSFAGCLVSSYVANAAADDFSAVESTLQNIRSAPAGAERKKRACEGVNALQRGAKGLPSAAPAGSAVDNAYWRLLRDTMHVVVDDLAKACAAKDGIVKNPLGRPFTVEQQFAQVDAQFRDLVDATKPRALPPAMQSFDKALRSAFADKKHKHTCPDVKQMKAQWALFPSAPPPGADAKMWKIRHDDLDMELGGLDCEALSPDEETPYDSTLRSIHDNFYALVLLWLAK